MSQNKVKECNVVDLEIDFTNNAVDDKNINTERNTSMVVMENKKIKYYKYFKRVVDIVLAIILSVVTFPLWIVISIAIKLDSKGPILYKQVRTGKDRKNFTMYKFRSMEQDNNVYDFSSGDKNTKVGNFLRKTSMDELPQLINIFKGEMSFIGPRPWLPEYLDVMDYNQKRRYDVLPGITGLAQVMGRNSITMEERIKYDLEYVDNYSFKEDIIIIFKTVKTVFERKGVNEGKTTVKSDLDELKEIQKRNYYN